MTFGSRLAKFASAVDIVSTENFDAIWHSVCSYAKKNLYAHLIEFLIRDPASNEPGLVTREVEGGRMWHQPLRGGDHAYQGYASFAFDKRLKLWFSDKNGLSNATDIQDQWQDADLSELPPYQHVALNRKEARAEILLPLLTDDHVLVGLLNFESVYAIDATEALKTELKEIAKAFARLSVLVNTYKLQRSGTNREVDELKIAAQSTARARLNIFLAYPEKSDPAVLTVVTKCLKKANPSVKIYDWARDKKTGLVLRRIIDKMSEAYIACCYLSEIHGDAKGKPTKFVDNKNVLVELGMALALSNDHGAGVFEPPVILREPDYLAGPPAFDYAGLRTVIVPRDHKTGELDRHALEDALDEFFTGTIHLS